jgi:hypothetical protein
MGTCLVLFGPGGAVVTLTFDDFISMIDRSGAPYSDLKEEVARWIASDDPEFPNGGPKFESLDDLLLWECERNGWHQVSLRWIWGEYLDAAAMVAAGVDVSVAMDAASTLWCDGCGCDWCEDSGPMLPDEVWAGIAKPKELLCSRCVADRLARGTVAS